MSSSANATPSGASSSSSTPLPRLGPAWYRGAGNQGGRGFQPPPAVPSDRDVKSSSSARDRSGSYGSAGSDNRRESNSNSFSALLDVDDEGGTNQGGSKQDDGGGSRRSGTDRYSSRSEALRAASSSASSTSFNRSSSTGSLPGGTKPTGRSLADLAARVPASSSGIGRSHSGVYRGIDEGGSGRSRSDSTAGANGGRVIRFTRERLLSMRPQPKGDSENPPSFLKHLEGTVVLAKGPQDPVCWDNFDADEIWAQAVRERPRGSIGAVPSKGAAGTSLRALSESSARLRSEIDGLSGDDRRGSGGSSGGRWKRGVALPPPDEHLTRSGSRGLGRGGSNLEADNPNDLWDDPLAGAAGGLSQFGALPDESLDEKRRSVGSSGGFDLSEMSEAAKRFEEELHGSKRSSSSGDLDGDEHGLNALTSPVDPQRPLATAGTTIRSGSGDDVNVFEDFDAPPAESEAEKPAVSSEGIKSGGEDMSASSRLMQMIGVRSPENVNHDGAGSWDLGSAGGSEVSEKNDTSVRQKEQDVTVPVVTAVPAPSSSIPSNPWGDTIISVGNAQNHTSEGMDLAARLEAAREAQAAAESEQQRQREEAERLRRRQEEEEQEKRRAIQAQQEAALRAQQQAEEQARQRQAAMQQQQSSGHSQLELILVERISTVLENSWGRSDLISILSTLHAEDSRVIPLLGNVNALRALIARHPRRVALTKDPAFGAEMAVLMMTNAQWQQQQAQVQAQQEELLRRRQQQLQAQQAAAARAQAEAEERAKAAAQAAQRSQNQQFIITDAPWFYTDPQGNIQGPFGGGEMRQWLEAGYFKGDLPISQSRNGTFRALSTLFPDLSVAFKPTSRAESQEQDERARAAAEAAREQEKRAKAEAEAAAAAAAAAEAAERAKAEAEKKAAAEKQKRDKEAADRRAAAEEEARSRAELQLQNQATSAFHSMASVDQNVSSAQLKMLLGLGGSFSSKSDSLDGVVVAGPPQRDFVQKEEPAPAPSNEQNVDGEQKQSQSPAKQQSSKTSKSQKRTSASQITVPPPAPASAAAPVSMPAPVKTPAPAAWGGVATAGKTLGRKKSMSEIQQEEAVAAARLAKERQVYRSSSGGWANIAASGGGSTAWSSGTVKQTPAVVVAPGSASSNIAASSQYIGTAMQQVRSKQQAQVAAAQKQSLAHQQRTSVQKDVENFGGNGRMSPSLENWCKEQMRKLSGSDDLTLIAFCMTLTDPIEIRQYLTAYLGSTSQVNNFATEFINRKNGGKNKQEEWETTGTAKKGRKKKGAAAR